MLKMVLFMVLTPLSYQGQDLGNRWIPVASFATMQDCRENASKWTYDIKSKYPEAIKFACFDVDINTKEDQQ